MKTEARKLMPIGGLRLRYRTISLDGGHFPGKGNP